MPDETPEPPATRRVPIRRVRQAPVLAGESSGTWLRFDKFTLDLEAAPPRT